MHHLKDPINYGLFSVRWMIVGGRWRQEAAWREHGWNIHGSRPRGMRVGGCRERVVVLGRGQVLHIM